MLIRLFEHLTRLLIIAALAFLIPACSSTTPTSTDQPTLPASSTPVTITFWHAQTGSAATLLSTLANEFHKAYPTITVILERKNSEGDLMRQGVAGIAMNTVPDLVLASNRTISEFARQGALVNLDLLIDDATVGLKNDARADFSPGILDCGRVLELKNQLYVLPFEERAIVLYYNLDLLRSVNSDVPRTWEQFGDAARATTRADLPGWIMSPNAAVWYAFVYSRGGSVLTTRDNQIQVQFGEDAGIKTMQMIAALWRGGAAALAPSANRARSDFVQGKSALLFGTTDDLLPISDAMARAGISQWGVTNIPQSDPDHPFTAVLETGFAIFKPVGTKASGNTNDQTRAAWLLARWLTQPEQAARWARTTFTLPVRLSAQALLANNLPPEFQRLRDGFGDRLPTGRPMPTVKDASSIDAAIVEMWASVASGTDPASALRNAVARTNRLLGQ